LTIPIRNCISHVLLLVYPDAAAWTRFFLRYQLGHLKDFVLDCTDQMLGKFVCFHNLEVSVIVGTCTDHHQQHGSSFECEAIIHDGALGRTEVAKSNNKTFEGAVRSCLKKGEKILRRASAKAIALRRRTLAPKPESFEKEQFYETE
jgi:hypothetical protein